MDQEETIEIEVDGQLLEQVGIIAAREGVTAEQYIRSIIEAYAQETQKPSPLGKVAERSRGRKRLYRTFDCDQEKNW